MFLDLPQRDNLSKPCYSIVFCTTVAIFLNFALAINYLVRYVSFDSVHETKLTHQLYIYTGSTTVYYNYTEHSCSANAGLTQCMLS